MHPLLARQLKRAGLGAESPPDAAAWSAFLQRVGQAYAEHDQERYVLERSLTLSSDEMQALYARLEGERDRLRLILLSIEDGLCALDADGRVLLANAAAERHLGWAERDLLGGDVLACVGVAAAGPALAALGEAGQPLRDENATFVRRDGSRFPASYSLSPIVADGAVAGAVLVFRDLSERRRLEREQRRLAEEQSARALAEAAHSAAQAEICRRREAEAVLAYQAGHDALTGLANRTLLFERMDRAIAAAAASHGTLSLLLLDLDRFKEVNDTLGHQAGDVLLQAVGRRLRAALRGDPGADLVARLGGDEFALLLPGADETSARQVAERLLALLREGVLLDDRTVDVEASVGIACYPRHGEDGATLLRHADIAMYAAKRARAGIAVYAAHQENQGHASLGLLRELREAVARDELALHFQPIVGLADGRVRGVEALVRWQHPTRGPVPPSEFIPLAEQTGLIGPLTRWVLAAALRQCRAWLAAGVSLGVSVNLSVRNLHDDLLPRVVADLLAESGVESRWLKLEITESMLMAEPARALDVLARLRGLGVRIAVDDFGTGYSSLAYLKHLPVHELKIDRSFVHDLVRNDRDVAIVRSAVELAHNLGLDVVAEGVEDLAAGDLLARLGCDLAQGYAYSRPLPAVALCAWLRERERVPAAQARVA